MKQRRNQTFLTIAQTEHYDDTFRRVNEGSRRGRYTTTSLYERPGTIAEATKKLIIPPEPTYTIGQHAIANTAYGDVKTNMVYMPRSGQPHRVIVREVKEHGEIDGESIITYHHYSKSSTTGQYRKVTHMRTLGDFQSDFMLDPFTDPSHEMFTS